jgi:hypothetical protein
MHELIANSIKFCDEAQNGMTRKEVIQVLMQLKSGSAKSCKNHYLLIILRTGGQLVVSFSSLLVPDSVKRSDNAKQAAL